MSDAQTNFFNSQVADATERAAFVPNPATVATTPDQGYTCFQQDDGSLWEWDSNGSAWVQVGGSGSLSGAALSLLGNATNAPAALADIVAASDFQVMRRSGTALAFGAVDLSQAAAVTGDLAFANLAQGSALSVLGVTGNATADNASIVAASDFQVVRRSGTAVAFGSVNLASSNAVTGTLPVGNGGTGVTDAAGIRVATVTISNNTTIQNLPTAAVSLVATPGAGFVNYLISCQVHSDFTAGAYGLINAAGYGYIQYTGGYVYSNLLGNDATLTPARAYLTALFGFAGESVAQFVPYTDAVETAQWGNMVVPFAKSAAEDKALEFFINNSGVNFNGGNAANSITFVTTYITVPV